MKNLVALVLLAAMLLQLTACGTSGSTAEPDVPGTENAAVDATEADSPSSDETETEPPEYTSPGVTYDGIDFTIAAAKYANAPIYQSLNYCESDSELTGDPISDALYERNNQVQEIFDIKFQTYPFPNIGTTPGNEMRQLVQAGETLIDLASISGSSLPTLLGGGILLNLLDVGTIDLSHTWYDQKSIQAFRFQNSLFAVSGDFNLYTAFSPVVVYFNKNILETNGMENPYDMVNEGTWVFEKMVKMAEAAASDLNGNGEVDITEDQFGMLLQDSFMTSCIFGGGTRITTVNSEGMPELALDLERASGIIDTLLPLFNNANVTIHASRVSGYGNVFSELLLPTFTAGRSLFFQNQLMMALDMREMEADFGILPHPKYNEEQESYHNLVSEWWASFQTIPVTNDHLDMTGNVMEALGYYSRKLVTPEYVEKTVKGKVSRDEDSVQMITLILDTMEYELASMYDWGSVFSMFAEIGRATDNTLASTFASQQKMFGKALENTLKEIADAGN